MSHRKEIWFPDETVFVRHMTLEELAEQGLPPSGQVYSLVNEHGGYIGAIEGPSSYAFALARQSGRIPKWAH